MKEAKGLSCASTFERLKIVFTDATSGSTKDVMNPHAKKALSL
jgi:hypothetical protein